MSQVLYRKYRSQNFDELIGQAHITDILKKAVLNGAISHAYLFVGSRGTGKTSTARILAKAINCQKLTKEGNPCNKCDSCIAITEGTFLDLIEIDAASNRGIDQIRELKERIEFSPVEGRYKIYIIDEVHMLTTEAFNALLKTLEEPPAHVVFMLATTDVHKLPATILSRCQRYDFHLGSNEQVAHVIKVSAENEGVKLSEGAIELISQNAKGSYRDALSLLDVVVSGQLESDKPNEVSENEVRSALGVPDSTMVYYLLEKIVFGEGKEALGLIKELDMKGVNFQQFIKLTLETLREILIKKIQGEDETEYSFAKEMTQGDVVRMIGLFIDAEKQLRTASLPSLVVEMIIAQSMLTNDPLPVANISKGRRGSKMNEPNGPETIEKDTKSKQDTGPDLNVNDVKENKVEDMDENEKGALDDDGKAEAEDDVVEEQTIEKELKIKIEDVENCWTDIVKGIQKYNGHLYAFLKAAKVSDIDGAYLVLEVPFNFHKDRIESPRSREAINDVFEEVLGTKIAIRCDVNETIQRKKQSSADVVLKNIQSLATTSDKDASNGSKSVEHKAPPKPRKVSKKVEAIFADL